MFKFTATYKNLFTDEVVDEEVYFHLITPELASFELEFEDGFEAYVKSVLTSKDNRAIFHMFVKLVEISYGRRDNNNFVKDPAWTKTFLTSQAWEKLFLWLTDDESGKNANQFWLAILPEQLSEKVQAKTGKKVTELSREELLELLENKQPAADLTAS